MDTYGSSHSRPNLTSNFSSEGDLQLPKSGYAPSNLTRQMRLQQLTTQLLWRLQQSSPFHSSSPCDLVLPKLPEASPKLGVPAKRAPLLPGLEESQGALYEIGVSDDGALVGLIEEELEESLVNLNAMAASLGCVVEVLRKVAVGECEWRQATSPPTKSVMSRGTLWVAEALIHPDVDADDETNELRASNGHDAGPSTGPQAGTDYPEIEAPRSKVEQLRVTLTGSTTAGKSSLLGTLSTSTLDNGRGKSRLSLLRHRHEITSGVTSSVAQELIGYHRETDQDPQVINYATSDASSWIDIHHLADRLVFMSDSPGQPRYAKSTFRTLVSWKPHWTVICVPADEDDSDTGKVGATSALFESAPDTHLSLAYISLCLKLGLRLVITMTKMDLATKTGLRLTLGKVLSALKDAGRKPVIMSNISIPSADAGPELQTIMHMEKEEIDRLLTSDQFSDKTVPIVLTSAVTGQGIGKLHALMNALPVPPRENDLGIARLTLTAGKATITPLFHTDEVFMIPPSKVYGSQGAGTKTDNGVVLCGHLARGMISVGECLVLGPFSIEANSSELHLDLEMRGTISYSVSPVHSSPKGSPRLGTRQNGDFKGKITSAFAHIRVVSIRNLRLPVRSLLEGQVGTIGVEPIASNPDVKLTRARKGMILTQTASDITGFRSITVSFSAADFASASSPALVLGGRALVYVNAIRAAVRVTSLVKAHSQESSSVFDFEDEHDGDEAKEVRITFRFVSSVEALSVGDRVCVVPTLSASGSVAGAMASGTYSGLSGFVGTVCETVI
jgi:GTPase